jgi:FMN phosphatase YigB (HAD superfamily)
MLSNHRGTWLRRRLDRFGLSSFFEHVVVSDETGFAKPDREACMAAIHGEEFASHVLFVDDQISNVRTVRSLEMHALHAGEGPGWITRVGRYLDRDVRYLLAEVVESDRA